MLNVSLSECILWSYCKLKKKRQRCLTMFYAYVRNNFSQIYIIVDYVKCFVVCEFFIFNIVYYYLMCDVCFVHIRRNNWTLHSVYEYIGYTCNTLQKEKTDCLHLAVAYLYITCELRLANCLVKEITRCFTRFIAIFQPKRLN